MSGVLRRPLLTDQTGAESAIDSGRMDDCRGEKWTKQFLRRTPKLLEEPEQDNHYFFKVVLEDRSSCDGSVDHLLLLLLFQRLPFLGVFFRSAPAVCFDYCKLTPGQLINTDQWV